MTAFGWFSVGIAQRVQRSCGHVFMDFWHSIVKRDAWDFAKIRGGSGSSRKFQEVRLKPETLRTSGGRKFGDGSGSSEGGLFGFWIADFRFWIPRRNARGVMGVIPSLTLFEAVLFPVLTNGLGWHGPQGCVPQAQDAAPSTFDWQMKPPHVHRSHMAQRLVASRPTPAGWATHT